MKKQLSSVLTAIAKVFLTDCFMEDGSLDHCDRLLDQALQYDPDNPEACQALADLRLTQNRRGESLMLVRRTVEVRDPAPRAAPHFFSRKIEIPRRALARGNRRVKPSPAQFHQAVGAPYLVRELSCCNS